MLKIWLAEDNPNLAHYYEMLLSQWNCEKIVLVTESVPPEKLEQLAAQGYQFLTLAAPFTREELHAVVFGQSCA